MRPLERDFITTRDELVRVLLVRQDEARRKAEEEAKKLGLARLVTPMTAPIALPSRPGIGTSMATTGCWLCWLKSGSPMIGRPPLKTSATPG